MVGKKWGGIEGKWELGAKNEIFCDVDDRFRTEWYPSRATSPPRDPPQMSLNMLTDSGRPLIVDRLPQSFFLPELLLILEPRPPPSLNVFKHADRLCQAPNSLQTTSIIFFNSWQTAPILISPTNTLVLISRWRASTSSTPGIRWKSS